MRLVAQELPHTRMVGDRIFDEAAFRELRNQMVQLGESEHEIDFGNLLLQFLLVPLDETADRHDRLDASLFQLRGAEDGVDRLLLGRVDETAGIDQNHVGSRQIGCHDGAVPDQLAHEPFRVDRRFVAAEGGDAKLHPR